MRTFSRVFVVLLSIAAVDPFGAARAQEDTAGPRLRAANRRLVALIRRELARPENRPHDVQARAARLGFDPEAIYRFVQREIRFEPYPGLRRGPAGVLVSGAGNALDQSSLLAALLRTGGYDTRLVGAELGIEKAETLLEEAARALTARPLPVYPRPFGDLGLDDGRLERVSRQVGLPASKLAPATAAAAAARGADWDGVLSLTAREHAFLKKEIEAAGIDPPKYDLRGELLRATRDHVWVQYRPRKGGGWIDLDPTFPALRAGQAVMKPVKIPVKPAAHTERFQVSLRLERTVDGKPEEVVLLEKPVSVPRLLEEPLKLEIGPAENEPPALGDRPDPGAVYKIFSGYRRFQARLVVGGEVFGSKVFDYDGVISEVTNAGLVKAVGGVGGGVRRGLGGVFGGGAKEEKPKTSLSRVWVDFALLRGDASVWKQRRTILAAADRPRWCPILSWRFFLQSHEIPAAFLRAMHLTKRLRNDPMLQAFMDWEATGDAKHLMRALTVRSCYYPIGLLELCRARQAFLRPGRDATHAGRWLHFPMPNIFVSGTRVVLDPEKKLATRRLTIDVVENGALVVDPSAGFRLDRETTAALGVFDTVLEQALVRAASGSETVTGAIVHFENARLRGDPLRFVPARDVAALEAAGVSGTDAQWIREHDPGGGYVLVAARGPAKTAAPGAWWSFDPKTGSSLGRISGGGGASTSEFVLKLTNSLSTLLCIPSMFLFSKPDDVTALKNLIFCFGTGPMAGWLHTGGFGFKFFAHVLAINDCWASLRYLGERYNED